MFVDPGAPQRDAIQEAATWLRAGGVVALAVNGAYVLACDARNAAAVARATQFAGDRSAAPPVLVAAPAGAGSIVPKEGVALAVCAGLGRQAAALPVPRSDPDEIERSFGDTVDLLLDTGRP